MRASLLIIAVSVVSSSAAWGQQQAALSLHPDNPHYFLWRGRPTVLVTSGEHYGALLNRAFDFETYLDELARHGLNLTRTFSGTYRETSRSFGITNNTLAPRTGDYLCPWRRAGEAGGDEAKFDLTQWNSQYFERLKDFMQAARERGIVVEMNLFCPMYRDEMWDVCPMNAKNNVNGIGRCSKDEVLTLQHDDLTQVQLAVTRKIAGELRGFDNLYYEVCNEPYARDVPMKWQRRIIDEIVASEAPFPAEQRHLISLNIANGRAKVEDPQPAVSIFNFHYCIPPDVVAMNYALAAVIGENETGFRGPQDVLYRTEGWDFLLAGGALCNNLDYSFTAQHPDGTFLDYKSPGGGSPSLRAELGHLKRFIESFVFIRMQPNPRVVTDVQPELSVRALVEEGRQYAIYLHVPLPRKPKNLSDHRREGVTARLKVDLPQGRYRAEWIDARTGEVVDSEVFLHQGREKELNSPAFDNDIALRIRAVDAQP